jgi:methyl-accepting chemotaxis protein
LIESQRSTATALQRLADTVEHNATNQHDLVLAMQVNSDKLEQLRGTVNDLQDHVQQLKEDWRNGRTQ